MIVQPGVTENGRAQSNRGITRITIETDDGVRTTFESLLVSDYRIDTDEKRVQLDFHSDKSSVSFVPKQSTQET